MQDTSKLFSASPGRLDLRQFSAESLEVIQEGAGDIILKGAPLANLNATVNGTGTIRAAGLEVRRVTIALNGKGHALPRSKQLARRPTPECRQSVSYQKA